MVSRFRRLHLHDGPRHHCQALCRREFHAGRYCQLQLCIPLPPSPSVSLCPCYRTRHSPPPLRACILLAAAFGARPCHLLFLRMQSYRPEIASLSIHLCCCGLRLDASGVAVAGGENKTHTGNDFRVALLSKDVNGAITGTTPDASDQTFADLHDGKTSSISAGKSDCRPHCVHTITLTRACIRLYAHTHAHTHARASTRTHALRRTPHRS